MTDREVRKSLEELLSEGHIEEEWDSESQDHRYSLTPGGKEYAEEQICEDDDMALFLFKLMWNDRVNDRPWAEDGDNQKKFLRIALTMRDDIGVNIVRVLKRNSDKYEGGPQIAEDAPEHVLEEFDPDNSSNSGGSE